MSTRCCTDSQLPYCLYCCTADIAFIRDSVSYHSKLDSVERLRTGALQVGGHGVGNEATAAAGAAAAAAAYAVTVCSLSAGRGAAGVGISQEQWETCLVGLLVASYTIILTHIATCSTLARCCWAVLPPAHCVPAVCASTLKHVHHQPCPQDMGEVLLGGSASMAAALAADREGKLQSPEALKVCTR